MSKLGLTIDTNYQRVTKTAEDARRVIRTTVHQPEKRATSRTLFLVGALTLVIAGGGALGLLR